MVLGAILLAAGASSRMGKPKLLLPWGTTSILEHLIHQWTNLGAAQVAVVRAANDAAVGSELDRIGFPAGNRIANPEPERGMFSSIQCAARWGGWKADLTHWAIVLGDQPHLAAETLRRLLEFAAARPGHICQPARRGRPRHPVLLPKAALGRLKDCQESNLKEFLENARPAVSLCELEDPGLDFDLDTPSDYEEARRRFASGAD